MNGTQVKKMKMKKRKTNKKMPGEHSSFCSDSSKISPSNISLIFGCETWIYTSECVQVYQAYIAELPVNKRKNSIPCNINVFKFWAKHWIICFKITAKKKERKRRKKLNATKKEERCRLRKKDPRKAFWCIKN